MFVIELNGFQWVGTITEQVSQLFVIPQQYFIIDAVVGVADGFMELLNFDTIFQVLLQQPLVKLIQPMDEVVSTEQQVFSSIQFAAADGQITLEI